MRKLIVGNWKMNGTLAQMGEVAAIGAIAATVPHVDVGLCLPATLLAAAAAVRGAAFIGGQDCHAERAGAYTGALSAGMLKEAQATWVIVGHSERRRDACETDAIVAAKANGAHLAGLNAILCVGENAAQRRAGQAERTVCDQLAASLPRDADPAWLAIAYEPVWAIGTGDVPTSHDVASMHAALRDAVYTRIGDAAGHLRILYGGSMTGDNAQSLLAIAGVDGGLVGGASLTAQAFEPVIRAAAL